MKTSNNIFIVREYQSFTECKAFTTKNKAIEYIMSKLGDSFAKMSHNMYYEFVLNNTNKYDLINDEPTYIIDKVLLR